MAPLPGRCSLAANHTLLVVFRWGNGFAFRKAGNASAVLAKLANQSAVSTVEPESYVRPALATGEAGGRRGGGVGRIGSTACCSCTALLQLHGSIPARAFFSPPALLVCLNRSGLGC